LIDAVTPPWHERRLWPLTWIKVRPRETSAQPKFAELDGGGSDVRDSERTPAAADHRLAFNHLIWKEFSTTRRSGTALALLSDN
jgi:hypothetical protein